MKANLDFQFYKSEKVDYNKEVHKKYDLVDSETLNNMFLNVIKSQLWRLGAKTLTRTRDIDEYVNPSLFM